MQNAEQSVDRSVEPIDFASQTHNVSLDSVFKQDSSVELSASDRLAFAKNLLAAIGCVCCAVFIAHGLWPDNTGVTEVFEIIKIGALPLITLIVTFYFPNSAKQ